MSANLPEDDIVHRYAQEYEWRADEGDYTPTEAERVLLEDFGNGLLSEVAPLETAIRDQHYTNGHFDAWEAANKIIHALEAQVARLTAEPDQDEIEAAWSRAWETFPGKPAIKAALTAFLERRMKG